MKEEYKEEVVAEEVVTFFHLGSEMAPYNLRPSKRKERRRREGSGGQSGGVSAD